MATTTNFGWETPDDTDLVKDGALAMRTLGNAIDASLVDLKGGTTGQVLAKASNTDLDYSWVTQDDANAIQNTIVDAKGDLITATGNDTPSRIAVGNNGETLVADSSASTGLRWQGNFAAGKNKIINGDFNIWQRGTNISLSNGTYTFGPDRFLAYVLFSAGSASFSQQSFTPGTAPVAGYEGTFFTRITNGSTATYWDMHQRIEDVRTFAGQTVTLSFWAKASTTTTARMLLSQNFGSGGSTNVDTAAVDVALTTSWQRFTGTFNLPSISGKTIGTGSSLRPFFYYSSGTINSTTIDTWGWQLEAGNTATAFQTATGTLGRELAACQRYYYRITNDGTGSYLHQGSAGSATVAIISIPLKSTMRVTPTAVDFSSLRLYDLVNAAGGVSAVTLGNGSPNVAIIELTSTGMTTYRPYYLLANTLPSYIGFSAEL